MSYEFRGRTIERVGVVGSGQIGPDIALHFAKVLSPSGTQVIVWLGNDPGLANRRSNPLYLPALSLTPQALVACRMVDSGTGRLVESRFSSLSMNRTPFMSLSTS